MRERLKFERAWIMCASKGARTLADVHRTADRPLASPSGGDPRHVSFRWIARPGARHQRVGPFRLRSLPAELQSLVMRSALEWVYERCDGTITIIPEAWEFLPQGRGPFR
jgi:hypothetical protein